MIDSENAPSTDMSSESLLRGLQMGGGECEYDFTIIASRFHHRLNDRPTDAEEACEDEALPPPIGQPQYAFEQLNLPRCRDGDETAKPAAGSRADIGSTCKKSYAEQDVPHDIAC